MKLRVAKKVLKRIRRYPWDHTLYRRHTVAAAIFRLAKSGPSPKMNIRVLTGRVSCAKKWRVTW